jgi:hypothetical protein
MATVVEESAFCCAYFVGRGYSYRNVSLSLWRMRCRSQLGGKRSADEVAETAAVKLYAMKTYGGVDV